MTEQCRNEEWLSTVARGMAEHYSTRNDLALYQQGMSEHYIKEESMSTVAFKKVYAL
jgi:hypothetical protein